MRILRRGSQSTCLTRMSDQVLPPSPTLLLVALVSVWILWWSITFFRSGWCRKCLWLGGRLCYHCGRCIVVRSITNEKWRRTDYEVEILLLYVDITFARGLQRVERFESGLLKSAPWSISRIWISACLIRGLRRVEQLVSESELLLERSLIDLRYEILKMNVRYLEYRGRNDNP